LETQLASIKKQKESDLELALALEKSKLQKDLSAKENELSVLKANSKTELLEKL